MSRPADRELRAESHVGASPEAVWAVLGDVRRMPDLSPELVRMIGLKPGGLRRGQWYLGVNRRGWVMWATRNTVTDVEPGRLLAWDTATSGARWIWELEPEDEGTLVVHRRPVPRRLTFLGCSRRCSSAVPPGTATTWERDMALSVARLKAAVEGAGGPFPAGAG